MKSIILFSMFLLLAGCLEEENCYDTLEVDYYRTIPTRYYTVTEPVYKQVCE